MLSNASWLPEKLILPELLDNGGNSSISNSEMSNLENDVFSVPKTSCSGNPVSILN